MNTSEALTHLKTLKKQLTPQQFRTIRGQILSGNIEGAKKGLERILRKKVQV